MNSLEFINIEIAKVKSDYKKHIRYGQTNFAIADEKRLKDLQQIKTELEAFEVVKTKLEYIKKDVSVGIEEAICQTSKFTPIEIKTYLKAVEVKNESKVN